MKNQNEPSVFFADLDVIFDTRLGLLLKMESDKQCNVKKIIENGYFDRDRDSFLDVDKELFKNLYNQRDKEILQGSMITPVVEIIGNFVLNTLKSNIQTPFIKEPKILINLFPYVLNEAEKEAILTGLRWKIRHPNIEFVSMTYSEITPHFLKKETSIISLYDPYEWLEGHSRSKLILKQTCPEVTMIGPLMLRNLEDKVTDLREFQKSMEMISKPFIDLDLIILKTFSASIGKNIKANKNNNTTKA